MYLSLVQEQADGAEGAVGAESAAELLQPGVFTILMVLERLAVAAGISAVLTLVGCLLGPGGVLGQHVLMKFVLPLAGVSADLAHERLGLMSKLVAVELVSPVTVVGTLVTLVPEISGVFPHVYVQIVLPFCDVAAL